MKVHPDHVRSFSLEINIATAHVTVKAVGPDAVLGPHPGNGHVRDIAQFQRQLTAAPVGRAVRGLFLQRPFKNPRLLALALGRSDSTCMARVQTGQSLDQKSLFPTSHKIGVATELLANRPIALPVGDQQYQSSSARLRRVSTCPLTQLLSSCRSLCFNVILSINHLDAFHALQFTINKEINDKLRLIETVLQTIQKSLKILAVTGAGVGLIALLALVVSVVK